MILTTMTSRTVSVTEGSPTVGYLLGAIFVVAGIVALALAIRFKRKREGDSAEVDAECVDIKTGSQYMGPSTDRMVMNNLKVPEYRYSYNGQEYTSSPILASNRPGYNPKVGPCKIRIDPQNPEKVFSSELTWVSILFFILGTAWLACGVFALAMVAFIL